MAQRVVPVGFLQISSGSEHGLEQPLLRENEFVAEPAFDTVITEGEPVMLAFGDLDQNITARIELEPTTYAAVVADGFVLGRLPRPGFGQRHIGHDGGRWAGRHAQSARDAVRVEEGFAHRRPDDGIEAAVNKSEGGNAQDLGADAHASPAENTFVRVKFDEGMGAVNRVFLSFTTETLAVRPIFVGVSAQLTCEGG